MIIKKYSTRQFAGIRNKDFQFEENLNVILGPNEAGKSTMVNGIVSTLFNSIKVGDRSKSDKVFKERFMPHPAGDYIDGKIHILVDDEEFILEKEWGTSPSIKLITPNNTVIKDETKINEKLKELMVFGEETYKRIIFSKQEDLKDALSIMTSDDETNVEVGDFLRKTVMELDGVSMDALENQIEAKIEGMYKKWDVEKEFPENNRGINNPYKVGYGHIVEGFYKKEELFDKLKDAKDKEKELEEAYTSYKVIEEAKENGAKLKDNLGSVESDIRKRMQIEPKLISLREEIELLKTIYASWPQKDKELRKISDEINELVKRQESLEIERELAGKLDQKAQLTKKIQAIEELLTQLSKVETKLKNSIEIKQEDISYLEKKESEISKSQLALEAGSLSGKIIKYPDNMELFIKRGVEESKQVTAGEEFSVEGILTIGNGEDLEIRITAGEIDVEGITKIINESKQSIEDKLQTLKVKSIEEAKERQVIWEKLNQEKNNFEIKKDTLIGDETLQLLKDRFAEFEKIGEARDSEEIRTDLKNLSEELMNKKIQSTNLEKELKSWIEKYNNNEELFDVIVEKSAELKLKEGELEGVKELPDEFKSADDFFSALSQARTKYEEININYYIAKEKYAECERNLPDTSFEELEKEYKFAQENFQKLLRKGNALLRIRDSFISVKERMDENTDKPLIESMSKYLEILTEGSYKVKEIGDSMDIRLESNKSVEMPLNLLSTGARDSVALAIRLALAENLLRNRKGLLVLDDSLVDMDPSRKDNAVEMIKEFAQRHQVIFTTCSPQTAKQLNGNIIEI